MTIKYFCDLCGKDASNKDERFTRSFGFLTLDIAVPPVNGAHVCRDCIATTISGTKVTNQNDLLQWCIKTFGASTALDLNERAARLVEEAIECAQAAGLSPTTMYIILQRVLSRPAGELRQEIGGCAFTLATLAEVAGFNAQFELQREFERVNSIDQEFFRAKQAAKVAAGTSTPNHAGQPFAWSPGPSK